MYLAILLGFIGLLSLTSLVISGICAAYLWGLKNRAEAQENVSLLDDSENKEIEEYLNNIDLDKINKKTEDAFEEEFLNPLKSRGL